MIDLLMQYGLFLAKAITIVVAIVVVMIMAYSMSRKARIMEKLEIRNLNEKYRNMAHIMKSVVLSKKEFKKNLKKLQFRP